MEKITLPLSTLITVITCRESIKHFIAICSVIFCAGISAAQQKQDTIRIRNFISKVFILGADSANIKMEHLKKGFELVTSDTTFKITGFNFGYITNGASHSEINCARSAFWPQKMPGNSAFGLVALDKAIQINIDRLYAEKNDKIYQLDGITYSVLK